MAGSVSSTYTTAFPVSPSSRESCVTAASGSDLPVRLERQVRVEEAVRPELGVRAACVGRRVVPSLSVPSPFTRGEHFAVSFRLPAPLRRWLGPPL